MKPSIDTQLFVFTGGLAVGMLFVAWMAYRLRRIYRTNSALVGALAFIALAARQVYGLLRLRSQIAEARTKGVMIDHLSLEQWLVGVGWAYLIVILFIVWMLWQRHDYFKFERN